MHIGWHPITLNTYESFQGLKSNMQFLVSDDWAIIAPEVHTPPYILK